MYLNVQGAHKRQNEFVRNVGSVSRHNPGKLAQMQAVSFFASEVDVQTRVVKLLILLANITLHLLDCQRSINKKMPSLEC